METLLKQYSKTLDVRDYVGSDALDFMEGMKEALSGSFYPFHPHRYWEYSLCINALLENGGGSILEVGGTGSIFAATAAWVGMEVTVVDPSTAGTRLFAAQNMILQLGRSPITFEPVDFFQYQNQKKFDAVVCISTLEHVPEDESFFRRLLGMVKEGGILLTTVDFHPSGKRLVDAHLRTYNQERLAAFIAIAKKNGFEIFGDDPDYSWRGENVYSYTFASLALKKKKRQEVPIVLFINNQEKKQDGVYQYGKRAGNILKRSEKCQFIYVETHSEEDYWAKIDEHKPNGIIYSYNKTMPWINSSSLGLNRAKGIFQVSVFHEGPMVQGFDYYISTFPDFPENEITFVVPRLLFEYENPYPVPQIPVINCFGFTLGVNQFVKLAQIVNQEFDVAILNLHMPFNSYGGDCPITEANACREMITKKGIEINVTHAFMPDHELLDFLAKGSLNAFLYHDMRGRGCASTIDFALSVKRPIAITKSNMMGHLVGATPSICVEDRNLKEIIASGFAPLEPYYEKWRPEKFIEAYEKIVERIL